MIAKKSAELGRAGVSVGAALTLAMLAGCATAPANRAQHRISQDVGHATQAGQQGNDLKDSVVQVSDGMYFSSTPYRVVEKQKLPHFFYEKAPFHQLDPISFQDMISKIGEQENVRITLSADAIKYLDKLQGNSSNSEFGNPPSGPSGIVDSTGRRITGNGGKNAKLVEAQQALSSSAAGMSLFPIGDNLVGGKILFTITNNGSFKDLLDNVTSKANLFWKWDGDHIRIFRDETKTFVIDDLPGTTDSKTSVSSSEQGGSSGGTTTGSQSNSLSTHTITWSSKPSSPFDSLEKTIKAMLSDSGTYSVSQSAGTVTVTDTPGVIKKIGRYVKTFNQILTGQIAVRTQIYDIQLSDNSTAGANWSVLYSGSKRFAAQLSSGGFANPSNTVATILGATQQMSGSVAVRQGAFKSTQALLSDLRKVANVSLVTTSTVYTTNGQPVPVQVINQQHYISSSQTTTVQGGTSSASVNQSIATSGITMHVTPRILSSGSIMLQTGMNMSQLVNMTSEQTGNTMIQLPDESTKSFMQRVILHSGQSLMISGFERTQSNENLQSLGKKSLWTLGGSKGGGQKKTITLIIITPYRIRS